MTVFDDSPEASPADLVDFAHDSERQFARLLDFYEVAWQYEPRSFPLEWDDQGKIAKAFTPDFYLEDDDLFIEITTMNQKLVTKKNQKIRALRERYPDINCKIFYQRDYLYLLVKYGLDDASEDREISAPSRLPGPLQVFRIEDSKAG